MSYRVESLPKFLKDSKKLKKKYPSIKDEIKFLISSLKVNPIQGVALSNNCYKLRMSIRSKGKGKSGGSRVITHIHIENEKVYLLSIYDKSDKETITDKEINLLLGQIE